jgi:hypothetical protein
MGADDSSVVGITQRELLMEMRDEIRALRAAVDAVARDQALSVERRSTMQRVADTITGRLDSHEKAILELQRWRDEAAGAIRLARWALGATRAKRKGRGSASEDMAPASTRARLLAPRPGFRRFSDGAA